MLYYSKGRDSTFFPVAESESLETSFLANDRLYNFCIFQVFDEANRSLDKRPANYTVLNLLFLKHSPIYSSHSDVTMYWFLNIAVYTLIGLQLGLLHSNNFFSMFCWTSKYSSHLKYMDSEYIVFCMSLIYCWRKKSVLPPEISTIEIKRKDL